MPHDATDSYPVAAALRDALDNAADAMVCVDADGAITVVNREPSASSVTSAPSSSDRTSSSWSLNGLARRIRSTRSKSDSDVVTATRRADGAVRTP